MKKIITQKEKDKKSRRKQLLIGGILVLLMIFSTAGYSLINKDDDSGQVVKYKGITFTRGDDYYWRFNYNGTSYISRNSPLEVSDVNNNINSISITDYKDKVLYTAGEPDDSVLLTNIYQVIQRHSRACVDENCTENAPIKECDEDEIIIIKEAGENDTEEIYNDENCVYIVSSYTNSSKYIDSFLFKILGLE